VKWRYRLVQAAGFHDDRVDGLGAVVALSSGVENRPDLDLPRAQRPAKGGLVDRTAAASVSSTAARPGSREACSARISPLRAPHGQPELPIRSGPGLGLGRPSCLGVGGSAPQGAPPDTAQRYTGIPTLDRAGSGWGLGDLVGAGEKGMARWSG
jgi:hypothetical protein